ncbi:MAG: hypothetical protein ABSC94_29865 [Polyangiaceae bacterium]|jgi:hypothetical protein
MTVTEPASCAGVVHVSCTVTVVVACWVTAKGADPMQVLLPSVVTPVTVTV